MSAETIRNALVKLDELEADLDDIPLDYMPRADLYRALEQMRKLLRKELYGAEMVLRDMLVRVKK